MKTFLINFMLFFYTEYIVEDWDTLKPIGRVYIYPFWFIGACIMWIVSPIFITEYLFKQSDVYKNIQKMQEEMLNFNQ